MNEKLYHAQILSLAKSGAGEIAVDFPAGDGEGKRAGERVGRVGEGLGGVGGMGGVGGVGEFRAKLSNPMCGDDVEVWVRLEVAGESGGEGGGDGGEGGGEGGGVIVSFSHRTRGCVLSRAASAALSGMVCGMTVAEARKLTADFSRMLNEGGAAVSGLEMFAPVAARPSRRHCALLPFLALDETLRRTK